METPLTITVTPQHLRGDWRLVLEFQRETQTLLTASILSEEAAARLPTATPYADFVIKKLGNVLAREAPGCFAPNKAKAVLTLNADGRIVKMA